MLHRDHSTAIGMSGQYYRPSRLNQNQRVLPSIPKSPQYHSEQLVGGCKARSASPPSQNRELLPKCQILQYQIAATTKEPSEKNKQEPRLAYHTVSLSYNQSRLGVCFMLLIY